MNRRRKRERSDNPPRSLSKRLRPPPEEADGEPEPAAAGAGRRSSSPSLVMVTGLPVDCTVLELKSRLEMYGPISRIRIDVDGSGYVAFRSDHSAEAAISASLDPAFGIAIRSKRCFIFSWSLFMEQKLGPSGSCKRSFARMESRSWSFSPIEATSSRNSPE